MCRASWAWPRRSNCVCSIYPAIGSFCCTMRNRLYEGILRACRVCLSTDRRFSFSPLPLGEGPGVRVDCRLPGNLNLSFDRVDGETLLIGMKEIALSSGMRALFGHTGAEPRAAGIGSKPRDRARKRSLRFGTVQYARRSGICHFSDHRNGCRVAKNDRFGMKQ